MEQLNHMLLNKTTLIREETGSPSSEYPCLFNAKIVIEFSEATNSKIGKFMDEFHKFLIANNDYIMIAHGMPEPKEEKL
jgi:hypothetical protein